uniref:Alpha/beta hydrolase n=1 Tax=Ditylenchus dipsaci TaxID=166011 RepID=A0A915EDU9_9BILA
MMPHWLLLLIFSLTMNSAFAIQSTPYFSCERLKRGRIFDLQQPNDCRMLISSSHQSFQGSATLLHKSFKPGTYAGFSCRKIITKVNSLTAPLNYYRANVRSSLTRKYPEELVRPKTLIIWGEKDAALDVEGAVQSVSLCRDAKLVRIPDASHWFNKIALNKLMT